jgi:hypothetical protein
MSFESCNRLLKIQETFGTPTPKVRAHLRVCGFIPSHSPTYSRAWNVIPGLHSWPTPLQTFALFVNPRLGLWQIWLQKVCFWFDGQCDNENGMISFLFSILSCSSLYMYSFFKTCDVKFVNLSSFSFYFGVWCMSMRYCSSNGAR